MRCHLGLAAIVALAITGCGLQPWNDQEADSRPTEAASLRPGEAKSGIAEAPGERPEQPSLKDARSGIDVHLSPYLVGAPDCTLASPIGLSGVVPRTFGATTVVLFIDLDEAGFEESDAVVLWAFGDGNPVVGDVAASHVYPSGGIYDVAATVHGKGRELTFEAVLAVEEQTAYLAGEACPEPVFCSKLDCDNGMLEDPCLHNDDNLGIPLREETYER